MAEEEYGNQFEPVSIGERLRLAREAKGLSLEDVANQTRIPIRHLQHIDREEWDALPAVTYCIGFVRSYATVVDLDGAELGRELRDRLGGVRTRAPVAEYYQPADPARVPPRSLALIAAIILAVLLIVFAVWRSSLDSEDEPVASVTVPVPEAQAPAQPWPAACSAPGRGRSARRPGRHRGSVASYRRRRWRPRALSGNPGAGPAIRCAADCADPDHPHRPAASASYPDRRPRHRPDRTSRAHRRQRQPEGRGSCGTAAGSGGCARAAAGRADSHPGNTSIISVA